MPRPVVRPGLPLGGVFFRERSVVLVNMPPSKVVVVQKPVVPVRLVVSPERRVVPAPAMPRPMVQVKPAVMPLRPCAVAKPMVVPRPGILRAIPATNE